MTELPKLVKLTRELHERLAEAIAKQERTLKYLAGEPYEPVAHPAAAILVGVGEGSAA